MNGQSSDPKLSCAGAQTKSRAGNKKSWVGLPGFGSVAGEIDIGRDGDFFTDLGTEAEIFRDLHCIVGELRGAGRAIEGMVDADGSKQCNAIYPVTGVFCQRVLAESAILPSDRSVGRLIPASLHRSRSWYRVERG